MVYLTIGWIVFVASAIGYKIYHYRKGEIYRKSFGVIRQTQFYQEQIETKLIFHLGLGAGGNSSCPRTMILIFFKSNGLKFASYTVGLSKGINDWQVDFISKLP